MKEKINMFNYITRLGTTALPQIDVSRRPGPAAKHRCAYNLIWKSYLIFIYEDHIWFSYMSIIYEIKINANRCFAAGPGRRETSICGRAVAPRRDLKMIPKWHQSDPKMTLILRWPYKGIKIIMFFLILIMPLILML